ncbi:type IV secretory system conjugative DNA transfer family protein [Actinoplanes sp. NPDC051859]|uniref:type IV secretory system conjugative DNA transfer family protein n=1 Tax=Actinoplanes sp. NPDC051859 TaxID=3363909 RepID=UPI0037A29149
MNRRPPLSSPGHHVARRGVMRTDVAARLVLLGVAVVITPIGIWTLWWAGQLSGLFTHAAWPDTTPGDAPRIALHLVVNGSHPAMAWPEEARGQLGPGWLLYALWMATFCVVLTAIFVPGVAAARRFVRRAGFARRRDIDRTLSADAVVARVDVVRPGLTVTETDDETTRAAKQARAADPLETGRFLGNDVLTKKPLYLANEYTLLVAAAPRVGNKTTRYVIPAVADARGAVLTTSTRLDVAEVTYERRAAIGPTHIFEPQGEIVGVPRLAWSPIEGAADPIVAMLRANGFASGSGIGDESVENGKWFRDQAATILRGLLHAAALDEHATMLDVLAWSQNPANPRPERILRAHGVDAWADRLTRHREMGGRARDTIQTVVAGSLDAFNDPRVLLACSPPRGTQFTPIDWLRESGTIYLVGTRDAQALIAPLLAAFAEDILYQARRLALTAPGGRIEPALYVIGDEITNIAPLPSLPSLMNEGGGSGIASSIFAQNSHQILDRWGDKGGRTILDSANARLFVGGSADVAGLRDAQSLAGKVDEVSSGASWGGGRASVNANARREDLFDISDLRTLPEGRAIALIGNLPPVELDVPAWWQRPDAAELTAGRDVFRRRLAQAA